MTINKQLLSTFLTTLLLASCSNLPGIKISIEDNRNRTQETTSEPQAETKTESEVATTKLVGWVKRSETQHQH